MTAALLNVTIYTTLRIEAFIEFVVVFKVTIVYLTLEFSQLFKVPINIRILKHFVLLTLIILISNCFSYSFVYSL